MTIRSPIIAVLGHVDHGKTTLLDSIRHSKVAQKEAGGITQMIGASYLQKDVIEELNKNAKLRFDIKIPGILLIDTPGHAAFANLRERGGAIADLAILVVDINQGFQPQTIESIKILKQFKTPFLIAANKIDAMHGWKTQKTYSFLESFSKQPEHARNKLDELIYQLVGKISEFGFDSERFDRITDFKKQLAIIPVSGKTKEGVAELLMLIAGISQKFLEVELKIEVAGPAKGSIIEVKEEKGLGHTIDVIIYDGILRKGDEIIFLTANGSKTTKVRGLLEPNLSSNNPNEKFTYVDEVVAASGVKIFAPELQDAVSGSPIKVVEDLSNDKKEIEEQFKQIIFEKTDAGVIIRADSLGSIEAILKLLKDENIPVKHAAIGKITRKDVLSAEAVAEEDVYLGAVLGFNVAILEDASNVANKTPVILSNIIYHLVDRYKQWVVEEKERQKRLAFSSLPSPAKIKFLPGFAFRSSKPAIFGIKVIAGTIKTGTRVINSSGSIVGEVKGLQHDKKSIDEATSGMEVALSCSGPTIGKDIIEGQELYVYLNSDEIKKWEERKDILSSEEKQVLEEVKRLTRKYF
ncbi:translation initiation factor IF-2 [Candidatus Micrarchaeota archaeon]|nr:translation initiation factor IF-2 [Candidatus Micrarchaeota archaeon]